MRRKDDFNKVFDQHTYKASVKGLYVMGCPNDLGSPRLGMVVAKKHLKKATDRNALKRKIRGRFRELNKLKPVAPGIDCVVVTTADLKNCPQDDFGGLIADLFVKFEDFCGAAKAKS